MSYSLNRMLDTGVGVAVSLFINGVFTRERLEGWKQGLLGLFAQR